MRKRTRREYILDGTTYRSGLELDIAQSCKNRKKKVRYEPYKISYTIPERKTHYTVDYDLGNGILVEAKGRFTAADRKKHLLLKKQHPNLDIRFVFMRPFQTISKRSTTTYADWCDKNGFEWAVMDIPDKWFKEKNAKSKKEIDRITKC